MARILYKGTPVHTTGELPAEGSRAPDFVLTKNDFSDVALGDFAGKIKILNIVPSLDNDTVRYTQLVPEISQEPDYDAVLEAVSKL